MRASRGFQAVVLIASSKLALSLHYQAAMRTRVRKSKGHVSSRYGISAIGVAVESCSAALCLGILLSACSSSSAVKLSHDGGGDARPDAIGDAATDITAADSVDSYSVPDTLAHLDVAADQSDGKSVDVVDAAEDLARLDLADLGQDGKSLDVSGLVEAGALLDSGEHGEAGNSMDLGGAVETGASLDGIDAVNDPCSVCQPDQLCVQINDGSTMCRSKVPAITCRTVSSACRAMITTAKSCSGASSACAQELCPSPFVCLYNSPCGNETPSADLYCYGS